MSIFKSNTESKYRFMLTDATYVHVRLFHQVKFRGISLQSMNTGYLQSCKCGAERVGGVDKILLLWDKWDPVIQGYFRNSFLESYKGDRHYTSQDDVDALQSEIDSLPEDSSQEEIDEMNKRLEDIKWELHINDIRSKSKSSIMKQFHSLGLPSFYKPGWEADDYGKIFADVIYEKMASELNELEGSSIDYKRLTVEEVDELLAKHGMKKSVFYTADSDWTYAVNPFVDFFKLTQWKNPDRHTTTYQDMVDWLGTEDIYEYSAHRDALFGSHNNLQSTANDIAKNYHQSDLINLISENGPKEFTTDPELYEAQLKTFLQKSFPGYEDVVAEFDEVESKGEIPSSDLSFIERSLLGITSTDEYVTRFLSKLDPNIYK